MVTRCDQMAAVSLIFITVALLEGGGPPRVTPFWDDTILSDTIL